MTLALQALNPDMTPTIKDIIQAVKESKQVVTPFGPVAIDADLFISALEKLEKEKGV